MDFTNPANLIIAAILIIAVVYAVYRIIVKGGCDCGHKHKNCSCSMLSRKKKD